MPVLQRDPRQHRRDADPGLIRSRRGGVAARRIDSRGPDAQSIRAASFCAIEVNPFTSIALLKSGRAHEAS
ncbi:hypothetical protein [Lysobacter gummosus]|uniref:hypothetical protein n=1 Tax=Lysobacter gummosus TaxID=262324 RepID=UPI00363819C3